MKIDSNKRESKGKHSERPTCKKKGQLELKNLQLDSKFHSNGTRSNGGYLSIMNQ